MKLKSWTLVLTFALATVASAATNDLTNLLQKGLFEEEANRDLTAAIANYQTLASAFDKDRQLAATAIFRLGECYRKLGNTNEAVVQYQRIIKEFGDQQTLATLSRQNLAGLGVSNVSPAASASEASPGNLNVLQQELEQSNARMIKTSALLETLKAMDPAKLREALPEIAPDAQLDALETRLNQAREDLIKLKNDYSTDHPKYKNAEEGIDALQRNIDERINGILEGLAAQHDAETTYHDHLVQALRQRSDAVAGAAEQLATDRAKLQQLLTAYLPSNLQVVELQRKIDGETATLKELTDKVPNAQAANISTDSATTDEEQQEIRRIQLMIQNSPDLINSPGGGVNGDKTPLQLAAEKGQLVVAKYLLDHGADVNGLTRNHGSTPLCAAAENGHKAMVELLLARGADVSAGGLNPLYLAVSKGFTAVAEVLLANKADVNLVSGTDSNGMRPIHIAARDNKTELVQLLINHGADVNVQDAGANGYTPLELAAMMDSPASAKLLVDSKAAVDARDKSGNTPLHEAARAGDAEMVSLLLNSRAAADSTNNNNATPLLLAVYSGHADTARVLLDHKADPNHLGWIQEARGSTGLQPIYTAINKTNIEILKLVLDAGADPESSAGSHGWFGGGSPLFYAINRNAIEAVRLLLEHGANPNHVESGWPAINTVLRDGRDRRLIALLLEKGADPNAKDPEGRTPLLRTGDAEIASWLIAHKADVNAHLPNGYTALMGTTSPTNFLKILLENGANPDLQETNGNTALHWAVYYSTPGASAILLAAKANPNIQNNQGYTPLDMAEAGKKGANLYALLTPNAGGTMSPARDRQAEIAELLIKAGGLANLPKRDRIEVRRGPNSSLAISKDSQGRNQTSLLESIAYRYALLSRNASGEWEMTKQVWRNIFDTTLRFPDFKKVVIYRRTENSAKQTAINVDVEDILNSGDCSRDVWLQWGDVVEIPEADHPVDEQWEGLSNTNVNSLFKCLTRRVTVKIKGESTILTLAPGLVETRNMFLPNEFAWSLTRPSFMLRSVLDNSKLVRVSSDLSRVKVTRIDPATKNPTEWILDCTDNNQSSLWLRDGDVIEVPEK